MSKGKEFSGKRYPGNPHVRHNSWAGASSATSRRETQPYNIGHSQNFLHNKELVASLMAKTNISSNDTIIEIGPGKGIITEELANKCNRLIAVEYDRTLAQRLKDRFAGNSRIQIVEHDFLKYDMPVSGEYKICANIPFNLTADIMKKVLECDNRPDEIYFIMQYEAFLKYAGQPFYADSLRSLLYKPFFLAELLHEFQPTDFHPVPKSRICFVRFHKKIPSDISDEAQYRNFLAYVFSTSGNDFREKTKKIFSHEQQKRLCKQLNINMASRLADITYEGWLYIFNVFLRFVPADKKGLIINAERDLKNSQSKIQKIHRNRNHGCRKFFKRR